MQIQTKTGTETMESCIAAHDIALVEDSRERVSMLSDEWVFLPI